MDRSLRVAFLSEHASPVALRGSQDAGGQNVYVDQVGRNLARLGCAVDVFTRRDSSDLPEVIDWAPGVRIVNLTAGPPRFLLKDDLWPFMPEFRDAFLRFMVRDGAHYDLLHGNFWMSGAVAVDLGRRLGVPVVQIFHAMGKTKRRHQADADRSPPERVGVELEVIREADRLIAQCPSERSELVDDYATDPGKVVVIPSGVDIETFRPVTREEVRQRIGLEPDGLVVAYVGRMLPRKDVRNIVRAVALLKGRTAAPTSGRRALPQLLLVGGETVEPDPVATPEIGELQQLSSELGIADRVRFTGKRQTNELRYYYGAGDVVVTTPWYEPFGLTPLEAMACGRPVVGSAVGGITFTIEHGITGFLVPPRDPAALAARLRSLLFDPDLQDRMGRVARARVERHFTWSAVAAHTAALYRTLLAQRGRPMLAMTGGESTREFDHGIR
jgi:D-inositol-3-phosphate glycosyltransferase